MFMRVFAIAIATILVGCDADTNEAPRVIVLYENPDYAESACEQAKGYLKDNSAAINQAGCDAITACPEMMPRITSCTIHDPSQEARIFGDELAVQLAVNSQCAGMSVMMDDGSNERPNAPYNRSLSEARRKPHWNLMIDVTPGAPTQSWSMSAVSYSVWGNFTAGALTMGDGTPKEIAKDICAIASSRGAKILN